MEDDRGGNISNPVINGKLHYPNLPDIDNVLHDDSAKKNT
jgi:hypothetical protein